MKEIGIRKFLGASIPSLLILLSKDYLKLIGVSAVIAIPVAYFLLNNWVDDFAYAVGINWLAFLAAGLIAIIIGMMTISVQSIKTALSNPVHSLRDE